MKKTSLLILYMIIFPCILLGFSIVSSQEFKSFYISNTGNDANDGLSPETAWQTFSKVRLDMIAGTFNEGDTILFNRSNTFTTSSWLNITVDGLTIGAYGDGDKPVIQGSSLYIFYGIAVNNITIRDLRLETIRRGIAFWGELYSIAGGAKNILIDNVDVYHEWERAMQFYYNVSHIIVRNCFIDSKDMCGDSILFRNASYVLVENNTISNMTHTAVTFYAHQLDSKEESWTYEGISDAWVIIRNNTFIVPRRALDIAYNYSNVLFENNTIEYYDGTVSHGGDQVVGVEHLIIRYNIYKDFRAKVYGEASGYGMTPQFVMAYHSLYHNTMYTPYELITSDSSKNILYHFVYSNVEPPYAHNTSVMNNIIYAPHKNNKNVSYVYCISPNLTHYSDMTYTNNIILVGNSVDEQTIRIRRHASNYYFNIKTMESYLFFSDWVVFSDNIQKNPFLNKDLTIKSTSPAIDAGAWLTSATESRTSKYIYVDKAQYFWPRVNIHNLNLKGDNIFVGSNKNLEVISVDYENNIIEVNKSITYKKGDIVSLSFYNGYAPDIGAFEFNLTQEGFFDMLIVEILEISNKFGYSGQLGWINEDINKDGIVNILDILVVSNEYKY